MTPNCSTCENYKPKAEQKYLCEDCTQNEECKSYGKAKVESCDYFTQRTCGNCGWHGEHRTMVPKEAVCLLTQKPYLIEDANILTEDSHVAHLDYEHHCQWKPIKPVCGNCGNSTPYLNKGIPDNTNCGCKLKPNTYPLKSNLANILDHCQWKPIKPVCEKCGGAGEVCRHCNKSKDYCSKFWLEMNRSNSMPPRPIFDLIPCPACSPEKKEVSITVPFGNNFFIKEGDNLIAYVDGKKYICSEAKRKGKWLMVLTKKEKLIKQLIVPEHYLHQREKKEKRLMVPVRWEDVSATCRALRFQNNNRIATIQRYGKETGYWWKATWPTGMKSKFYGKRFNDPDELEVAIEKALGVEGEINE
jgi:hypothetical protein